MVRRRSFSALLAVTLVVAFAACGDDDDGGGESGGSAGGEPPVTEPKGPPCTTGAEGETEVGQLAPDLVSGQSEGREAILAVLQYADDPAVQEFVDSTIERAEAGGFPSATARTDSVEFLSDHGAAFTFTLLVGEGMAEIPQGEGFAACVDGEWKFSLDTFCNVSAQLPPGCSNELSDLAATGLTPEQFARLGEK